MNVFALTKEDILRADLALQPGFLDFLEEKGVRAYIHTYIYTYNVKHLWMSTQATMLFFRLLKEYANVYAFRNAYINVLFSKYFCA